MTKPIEDREITGVSWKTVRWVIGSTVIICMSVAGSYYGIQQRINDFTNQNMLQDLKIKTNDVNLKIMQTKLQTMEVHINQNTIEIERLKSKIKD